jgi:putative colanic acid biosynthesis acetyltransferase WcaF
MYNTDTYTGPSFSLKNRIRRVIWYIFYLGLFKYSPRFFHSWRSFVLRCFGAKIGKGVHIYPKVIIWAPWNLEIADNVGIANGVNLYSQGKIIIGKKSIISQGSFICTGSHDYRKKGNPLITKAIIIKDNVWIAAECFIHPGSIINSGAIIGARSVVSNEIPSWSVCVGFPCKFIKKRETENDFSSNIN